MISNALFNTFRKTYRVSFGARCFATRVTIIVATVYARPKRVHRYAVQQTIFLALPTVARILNHA